MTREPEGVPLIDLADPFWDEDPTPAVLAHGWWEPFVPHYAPPRVAQTLQERILVHLTVFVPMVLHARDHYSIPDAEILRMHHEDALQMVRSAVEAVENPQRCWVGHESLLFDSEAAMRQALVHPMADPEHYGALAAEEWIKRKAIRLEEAHLAAHPDVPCDMREIVLRIGRMSPRKVAGSLRYHHHVPFGTRVMKAFALRWHEVIDRTLIDMANDRRD